MKIEIRPIKEKELNEAATCFAEAFNQAQLGEKWTEKTAKSFLVFWFKKSPNLFLVAIQNSKIVGGIIGDIIPFWDGIHLEILELFVHPNFQNQGIAKKLLEKMISKTIKEYKIEKISGFADLKNIFPMSWYKRLGFNKSNWIQISGNAGEILNNLKN